MGNLENAKDRTADNNTKVSRGSNTRWRLPLLLVVVLAAIVLVNRAGIRQTIPTTNRGQSAAPAATAANGESIALTIDFGDGGRREWNSLPWHDGMTVAESLSAVAQSTDDGLEFAQQGTGASAFLTRFGETANEGAGGRNWTYEVNGHRADRSFAVYVLQPGDRVLWKFGSLR